MDTTTSTESRLDALTDRAQRARTGRAGRISSPPIDAQQRNRPQGHDGQHLNLPCDADRRRRGQANVVPDLASLSVTVNRSATTSRAALSAANASTDLITSAIRALGVPSSGIQTQSVSVSNTSHSAGPKGHRHLIRRFTATEALSVTSAATLAGAVIDAATQNRASSVDGLSFSFSNPAAGQIAANAAALADAQQQASAAAATLGYTVTGVQSVALNPPSRRRQPRQQPVGGRICAHNRTDADPGPSRRSAS